jgi:L,D-transpeptidase catalytic domain
MEMLSENVDFPAGFVVALRAGDDMFPAVKFPAVSAVLVVFAAALSGCVKDIEHQVVISTVDQKMTLLQKGVPLGTYEVSTSKFGLGDVPNSFRTPVGRLEVEKKMGAVFKNRERTGEILAVDSPGRDPIVTRIIWLKGTDANTANAFDRTIYIHGTPEERNLGKPASYGCVRMRSADIAYVYAVVGWGAEVLILDIPLDRAVRYAQFKKATL